MNLEQYLSAVSKVAGVGDAREESYYPALERLFSDEEITGRKKTHVTVLPKKTEAGNPDFRVWDGKHRIVGYIEAKVPGENLDVIERSKQLQRYRSTFPNLILTDFYEFRLYRDGNLLLKTQIGRPFVAKKMKTAPPLEHREGFEQMIARFFDFSIPSIRTSKALALELAKRTRFLRDDVIATAFHNPDSLFFEKGEEKKAEKISGYYEAFKKYLIASLTVEDFADLYAQTITYGLFTARHRFDTTPNLLDKGVTEKIFTRENAYKMIPQTLGILQDVFHFLSSSEPPKQLQVIIEDIAEVLAEADLKKITEEFFHAKRGRDPIVHFYETFLADYDPAKRSASINAQQKFTGIPSEVWNYHIGGYQVLDKWLKDRKGRMLSNEDIRHYCRVATALSETMKLQKEIDEVIAKHGGFPLK
jgi:hypothetical protein